MSGRNMVTQSDASYFALVYFILTNYLITLAGCDLHPTPLVFLSSRVEQVSGSKYGIEQTNSLQFAKNHLAANELNENEKSIKNYNNDKTLAVEQVADLSHSIGLSSHAHSVPFVRVKRLARAKTSRVPLAQRPRTSTTTTTTTTTSTTTPTSTSTRTTSATDASFVEEESDVADDDYEELVTSGRTKVTSTTKRPIQSSKQDAGDNRDEADEEEMEEEGEEGEEEVTARTRATTTTTTTTTTRRPTMRKSSVKSKLKSKVKEGDKKDKISAQTQVEKTEENESKIEANTTDSSKEHHHHLLHHKKRPLVSLPFIRQKNSSACISEAYLEFPRDLIGTKWRSRGLVIIHLAVVCYMFYSLALVCERYFMPSLEEFVQRLQISEDVAGATLMSAGSSAPELFTALLGVFVAKGDVGTGAIVGSAVFNILFVIGLCAFVSTTTAQLQWWPVLRDSIYYTFTVLVLILIIYDERITAFESASMIALYGVYILIMANNEALKERVTRFLLSNQLTAKLISSSSITIEGPDDVFGVGSSSLQQINMSTMASSKSIEDDSIYMAALLIIIRHKRLFGSTLRFRSAAQYVITKRQHRVKQKLQKVSSDAQEVNYFGPESEPLKSAPNQRAKMEAYAKNASLSKNKFSIVSKDDYEFWNRAPEEGENYYLWLARIPVNYVLHYTIPDCSLYPDKYIFTFIISIIWTAFFSYIMVWMVTLIGYTFGIPDSVMGVTFLAAGTSVPDCYSSIHAARNGMADMAVSNSIGSNVFDILIGLSVPWFIQSAIYPGIVATINSRGVIYSVVLLFLSLIITIYLLNKYDWSLQPRLGLALLISYGLFIILTVMLEFNLFGHVNPPPCVVIET